MISVSGRRSSSTRRVVVSARTSISGATITSAVIPSVPAPLNTRFAASTWPGHAARIATTAARASSMPLNNATPASALASSTIAPKTSFRDAPTARATTTSPLRAAVRARWSASNVAAPTASVSSVAPRTMDSSCSTASCCTCGHTTAFAPQSASSVGVSPSAMVSDGFIGVPPSSVSAGSAPASVSAAVRATSAPVPACHRRASAAALRRAIRARIVVYSVGRAAMFCNRTRPWLTRRSRSSWIQASHT